MLWLLALKLVTFTGPDDQIIEVNADEIVSVRTPRSADHFGPGIRCLINTSDGKYVSVKEECSQVVKTLQAVKDDPQ